MLKLSKNLLLATMLTALAAAAHAGDKFRAELSGDEEVPPVTTDTSGDFRFDFDDFEGTGSYRLKVLDGVRVSQAHIHCAPAGLNGPVIIFLAGFHNSGWDVDGKWIDNATVTDANIVNSACGATLADIVENMRDGNTYVNVHTAANPGGEVRGQIEEK